MLKQGDSAPLFSLPDQEGTIHSLSEYKGKKVLVYFYPKDDTPGCTTEACNFRDGYKELQKLGLVVLGISKDSVKSHKKFAENFHCRFQSCLMNRQMLPKLMVYGKRRNSWGASIWAWTA